MDLHNESLEVYSKLRNLVLKYTVIVPVYNAEKYLYECVSSIVSQIRVGDELIIVDDGSKDHSKEIYYAFAREYPQIRVIQQENQGVYAARQCGIHHATGDYIIFVDADDTWTENTLSEIDRLLTESNIDMLVFNYQKMSEKGKVTLNPPVSSENMLFDNTNDTDFFLKIVLSGAINSLCTKVIRRECISSLQTLPGKRVKIGEDFLQSLFFLKNVKSIEYTPVALYNYRVNPEGASHRYELSRIDDLVTVYSYLYYSFVTLSGDVQSKDAFWHAFFAAIHFNSVKFWGEASLNEIKKWNCVACSSELFCLGIEQKGYAQIGIIHRLTIFAIWNKCSIFSKILGKLSLWRNKQDKSQG